ncbi:UDP-N-acetylmuramate--L-alanine ligase [bacterium]|nr:UDP-N-acetylmuramate--L-alanine ligase [bacterium]
MTATAASVEVKSAHLVGICGSGMKALAQALLAIGVEVSGSDSDGEKAEALRKKGATVYTGHAAENLANPDVLVYSTAISEANPEIRSARERGIPLWHRSQMLAWFLARYESVLIAGTHGKTTTTTLVTLLLQASGMNPWSFVGGHVPEFHGNSLIGGDRLAVAEADESDGSFLGLPRQHAIITNIEDEHLNYWQTSERMFAGFEEFARAIPAEGHLVCSADDPGVARLVQRLTQPVTLYSTKGNEHARWQAREIELRGSSSAFDLYDRGTRLGRVELGIPGIHNVANATGSLALALQLGADFSRVQGALANFHGVDRRFTKKDALNGCLVIDDYGHHPTEMRVTVEAARRLADERGGRLLCVIQPHRYSRTSSFFGDFGRALKGADEIFVMEIYAAGEEPIDGVNGQYLAQLIGTQNTVPTQFNNDFEALKKSLLKSTNHRDIVLLLGAGSITKLVTLLTTPAG